MDDVLIERLKKIQALAERGVGGEKITAQEKLKKLLDENNMTEADLNQEEQHYYLFSYSGAPHRQRLLGQIIYKVLGHESHYSMYKSKGTRNKYGIYCTPAQKIEIDLDYEFYCNLFETEIDLLLSAFIQKQDLFPDDAPHNHINPSELNEQELEELKKLQMYQGAISKRYRPAGMIEENIN